MHYRTYLHIQMKIHADDKVKRSVEWTQTMDETKIYLEKYKEATQCGD